MKKLLAPRFCRILSILIVLISTTITAQVGINTTTPADGSILDIVSSDKGMLVPRVDITNLSTIAPITGGSTESLLVYNTNTTTGPGFFYWDGSIWVGLSTSDDWKERGNAGTDPNNDFIGTTDNVDLNFRTNDTERMEITSDGRIRATESGTAANPLFGWSGDTNKGFYSPGADEFGIVTNGTERLRIPNANQIHAMANGSNGAPFYSWNNDSNTGIWRSGGDRLNISAGGREMIEFRENGGNSIIRINDGGDDTDFVIEGSSESELFSTDAGNDRVGFFTDSPATDIQIAGETTEIRVDAFSDSNDTNNNGVDPAAVYVDANGNLTLAGPLTLNNMPEDNLTTFVPLTTVVESAAGSPGLSVASLYTTTITLTQDALIEVVYQLGANISDIGGVPITDGAPRQYGTALFIDGSLVGYTSEAFTSSYSAGGSTICNGTFFLNGNGYAQLTGAAAGTTYTVSVVGFVWGADFGARAEFGGNTGADRFQLILHH